MKEQMTLGQQIRHFRIKKGLTQDELAEKIGMFGKQAIYQYEKNIRKPKINNLKKIEEALGCRLE